MCSPQVSRWSPVSPSKQWPFGIPVTSELAFAAAMLPTSVQLECVSGPNGKFITTPSLPRCSLLWDTRSGQALGEPLSKLASKLPTRIGGGLSLEYAAVLVSWCQLEAPGHCKCMLRALGTFDNLITWTGTTWLCQDEGKAGGLLKASFYRSNSSKDVMQCCTYVFQRDATLYTTTASASVCEHSIACLV